MARIPTIFDWWGAAMQTALVAAEAQTVIALRLWGMAADWHGGAGERERMIAEKAPVFARAAGAAMTAALALQPPPLVALAALRPIRARTRANLRRLSRPSR
ncbi:hypothetical protein [Wenxinia saemankumensis]|uniref:Antifreeze protein n=1 Tax=Wenxinia saemankumensis TaxID=1447782 RepID=A0A1M6ERC8_9RHOB|nr:hypothetical protein [Wenxinia saemankumensis]SHI87899.1 hypothetical protein SAMN05444417_2129 [Wenxinia saemankumensis]